MTTCTKAKMRDVIRWCAEQSDTAGNMMKKREDNDEKNLFGNCGIEFILIGRLQ